MQCPNCNAAVFENDRFCGECGTDVSALTTKVENTTQTEQQSTAQASRPAARPAANSSNAYVKTALSFAKNALLKPASLIGGNKMYAPSVTAGTVGILTVILSLLFFIMTRATVGEYTEVPISALFNVLIISAVIIAVFYGITMLMNILVLKTSISWKKILHDFSVSTTIVLVLFIIAIAFSAITLVEISAFFMIIGLLLFITAPIYIFMKYATDDNVKFDSFYALIIYFVANAIVYYITVRLIVAQSMYYIEDLFMF